MKYDVVYSSTLEELAITVSAKLAFGWEPQGGVFVHTGAAGGLVFFQAIVKGGS